MADCGQYNDNHLFGPNRPVSIGDRWFLDGTRLKNTLGYGMGTIRIAQGNMQLDRIEGAANTQVAVISGLVSFGGHHAQHATRHLSRIGPFQGDLQQPYSRDPYLVHSRRNHRYGGNIEGCDDQCDWQAADGNYQNRRYDGSDAHIPLTACINPFGGADLDWAGPAQLR